MKDPSPPPDDARFMMRALQLARRGQGRVEPNPMVGCVLVRDGRIVGEGYHHRFGGHHAEVEALRRAGRKTAGATAYVTLEPCNHFGKTPPCTDALVAARIRDVVAAMRDPNPLVAGNGLRILRRAGIGVREGLLRREAEMLNAPYLKLLNRRLPYVIAKWAQSLDGKIATRTGQSSWISGPQSRKLVHRLRSRVDAIMVGSETVLADDPLLTARGVPVRRTARRIILDTRLRTPPGCRLVRTARKIPTLVFTSARNCTSRAASKLRDAGVELRAVGVRDGHVDLAAVLRELGRLQMSNVLIEGGGQVLGAAFDHGLLDEAYVFVAPCVIGGTDAPSAVAGRGLRALPRMSKARASQAIRVGSDLLCRLHF